MNLTALQTALGITTSVLVVMGAMSGGMFALIKLFLRIGGVLRAIDTNTKATDNCTREINGLRTELREEREQRRAEVRDLMARVGRIESQYEHD